MARNLHLKKTQEVAAAHRRSEVMRYYVKGTTQSSIAAKLGVSVATVVKDIAHVLAEWKSKSLRDMEDRKAEELAKLNHLEEVAWIAYEKSCDPRKMKKQRSEEIPDHEQSDERAGDGEVSADEERGEVGGGEGDHRVEAVDDNDDDEQVFTRGSKGRGGREDRREAHIKSTPTKKMILSKLIKEEQEEGQCGDPRFLDRVAWCIETRMKTLGMFKLDKQDTGGTHITINWDDLHVRGSEKRQLSIESNPIEKRIRDASSSPVVSEENIIDQEEVQ